MRFILALLLAASPVAAQSKVVSINGVKTVPFDPNPGKTATPIAAPSPAKAKPAPVRSDLHSHRCAKCGHEWWHGPENNGNASAHRCPACGAGPFYQIHRRGPQRTSSLEFDPFAEEFAAPVQRMAPRAVQACPT